MKMLTEMFLTHFAKTDFFQHQWERRVNIMHGFDLKCHLFFPVLCIKYFVSFQDIKIMIINKAAGFFFLPTHMQTQNPDSIQGSFLFSWARCCLAPLSLICWQIKDRIAPVVFADMTMNQSSYFFSCCIKSQSRGK